jgi:MATE family multidrug resistance protein
MDSRFTAHNKIRPYQQVLRVSLPLVVSMSSTMIMEFTDRIFLANYALDAIAAALPAGIAAFLFISFFLGTAQYLNVFVAQYTGSGRLQRVGPALWQGIYFSVLAAAMAGLFFLAGPIFALGGAHRRHGAVVFF